MQLCLHELDQNMWKKGIESQNAEVLTNIITQGNAYTPSLISF